MTDIHCLLPPGNQLSSRHVLCEGRVGTSNLKLHETTNSNPHISRTTYSIHSKIMSTRHPDISLSIRAVIVAFKVLCGMG
jgi:hypothetical protein